MDSRTIIRVDDLHQHDSRDSMSIRVGDLRDALFGLRRDDYVYVDLHSGKCKAYIVTQSADTRARLRALVSATAE